MTASVALAGAGARRALAGGGTGAVGPVFRRACYVRFPRGWLALVAGSVPPGPLHLVADGVLPAGLQPGRAAWVDGSRLHLGPGVTVDLTSAQPWTGLLPHPDLICARGQWMAGLLHGAADESALHGAPWHARLDDARSAVAAGDLRTATARLAGAGPGLTPAGDDALAGILLVARCRWGAPGTSSRLRLARRAPTADIPRAFLAWAALGQSIAPVHDFLVSGALGDQAAAGKAVTATAAIGGSSGADLCLGLAMALATLPPDPPAGAGIPPREPVSARGVCPAVAPSSPRPR